jgi:hypothetical protein
MKKRNILITLTAAILLVSGAVALAGNFKWLGNRDANDELPDSREELKRLYAVYSKPDSSFAMKGVIRLHDTENKNALTEETPFQYVKVGSACYSQLGYLQTFCADSFFLQLDTLNKQILLSKFDSRLLSDVNQSLFPFEKYMNDTSSSYLVKIVAGRKGKDRSLTVTNDAIPEIKQSVVFYDPVTYRINRVEIEWWKDATAGLSEDDQNRTWFTSIDYQHMPATMSPASKIYSIITVKNGRIELAPAFRDYEVQSTF